LPLSGHGLVHAPELDPDGGIKLIGRDLLLPPNIAFIDDEVLVWNVSMGLAV